MEQDKSLIKAADGDAPKKNKIKGKLIGLLFLLVILLAGGSISWYIILDREYFFQTENAQVMCNTITISPLVAGNLSTWTVKEGDTVKANQVLGRLDTSSISGTSEVNIKQLEGSASLSLKKSDIKTPIDGKIVKSNVVIGEALSPGMEAAIVADTSKMYIKANIEETDIFRIEQGQFVDIKIDAYPGIKFTGYVERVGQATNDAFNVFASLTTSGTFSKTTQLIPVRITIVNDEDLPLILGMNATVKIHVKDGENADEQSDK